jgi:RNA polymerase sigma factor (sigma-70 family)
MKKLPDDPMDMDQIYRTYERMVYQFLYMRTHDAHWSQDLLQETFLRAVTSISRYDGSCKLSVWLCQIARHVLWQELRKRGKTDFAELADSIPDPGNPDAETQVLQSEDRVGLYRAIHRLSEKEREVVLYRITGELSFREIGEILEKSENWARTTFYRAKLRLREELEANERNDRP